MLLEKGTVDLEGIKLNIPIRKEIYSFELETQKEFSKRDLSSIRNFAFLRKK
jgi:hypothetical protein